MASVKQVIENNKDRIIELLATGYRIQQVADIYGIKFNTLSHVVSYMGYNRLAREIRDRKVQEEIKSRSWHFRFLYFPLSTNSNEFLNDSDIHPRFDPVHFNTTWSHQRSVHAVNHKDRRRQYTEKPVEFQPGTVQIWPTSWNPDWISNQRLSPPHNHQAIKFIDSFHSQTRWQWLVSDSIDLIWVISRISTSATVIGIIRDVRE